MNRVSKIPFHDMTSAAWANLAAAALGMFYLIYLIVEVLLHTMSAQLGVDYADYYSAAIVADRYGFSQLYDTGLIRTVERSILPPNADPSQFPGAPFPYLPVFVLPFQVLSRLTPELGFWIWTVVNSAFFIVYIRRYTQRLDQQPLQRELILLAFISLPMFLNIFVGQVAVWLAVCAGEFMRSLIRREPFRAGLWLGGLLLKPQVLAVIGLVLLIQRAWRVLVGLVASSSILIAVSLVIANPATLIQMVKLWISYGTGGVDVWPEQMMNWRMVGVHLSAIAPTWVGTAVAVAGTLGILMLTIMLWRHPFDSHPTSIAISVLGILTASTMFAWHSHIHMALMLVPALVYLCQENVLSRKAFYWWVFLPAFFFFLVTFMPEAATKMGIPPENIGRSMYLLVGASELAVNLYLFGWAAQRAGRIPGQLGLSRTSELKGI